MTEIYTIIQQKPYRSNYIFTKFSFTTFIFIFINFILVITTITFALLWRKQTSTLLSSKKYSVNHAIIGFPPLLPNDGKYIQWTILQLNDVYEMLLLAQERKGGLARVCALSQAKINGTTLDGKQMIASFNTLESDFVTFGNHEFDLSQTEFISRTNESTFKWISSNVFQNGTNQSFTISIPYHILTIDKNQPYVPIVN